ncbi:MAG: beta strand repeat-containing protein [Pseudomonadota bacterium]
MPTGPGGDSAIIGGGQVVTIDGAQSILTLTNAGSINIDAFLLALQGGGSTTNTGTINVGAGPIPDNAALSISAGHNINNTGGVINVSADSVINQFGSTITGGTINTTGTGRLVAFNSASNFLNGVTLNGTLDLASGTGIERVAGGLTLNGAINIGAGSALAPQGDQTIGGNGTIVFADNNTSNRLNVEAGNLTLGSGITVRGDTGRIGGQNFVGGGATLTNNGTISADVAGGAITLDVNGLTTNNGVLSAMNGGTLNLNSAVAGASGSQIIAGAGSIVSQNGVTLSGDMNLSGAGSFRASNSGSNVLSGVTLMGTLDLASAVGIERVAGGLTLNGAINIGTGSILAPQGDQTIGGNGTIVFADNNASNRLNVEAGNLTLGSGITVRGQNGLIGAQNFLGGAATLTNDGTITADVGSGAITLAVQGLTTNNGVLSAMNGGTLNLNSAVAGASGSQIIAGAGSIVSQNGVTLSGDMNLSGAGSFRASNSGSNVLSGVTLTGTLDLASAVGIERVAGGLTLNGAINIGTGSILAPQGDQTIGGNGTIVFADNNASNRLNVEAGNLTLGSGITVRGQNGLIGAQNFLGGAATLTNDGTITADVGSGAITLAVQGLTTNNGVLSAMNGGTLNLNSAVAGASGSQIIAGAGSIVSQNGVTLSGDMNLSGAGSFRASNNGNNVLSGVTLNGTLDLASAVGIERVAGGLTLNGAINIGAGSILAPQGDQTIGGNGTIVFADADANNRLNVEAGTTTLGSGITVRGGNGIIGNQSFIGGGATLVNQGVIAADVSGRTITVQTTGGTTNQNVMRADNGGTLLLQGSGVDNSAGTLLATNGSTVRVNGITVTGGLLESSGSGRITATNSGSNFLNGTTLNGLLDLVGGGIARISSGGMTVNGRIDIGAGGVLAPQGAQTIDGSGQIVFTDANTANRLNIEAGALTIGAGLTVRGQTGGIGAQNFVGGGATLTNLGTINSDAGGTITVNPNGALTNNGLFRAQNGTLAVQRIVTGTGTLQVDGPGAMMTLANGGNTQGQLVMGAAGAAINLGTGNLTIDNDYTNAGAGTGNSFNRRAGVSGTGLIVAGGDAAQAITGATVTDGTTANATLTIGNVRVGATTFDYQIANTGTTGPTLRGAIQTSVNGANLTDARLSGVGITGGGYTVGGPGNNSGNLGVTFTAASAGALAPLTGQVLNLRSNFENIADQKLNIVLGAGAAAYNAAVGSASSPVVVANQRVGGSNSALVTVTNAAPAGLFSEDLNVTVGGTTGAATGTGSIAGRLAGTNNTGTGAISVAVDTATAGAKTGGVTLNYETAGAVAGVSNGLGTASVGSEVVTVTGNVYRLAQGAATPATTTFGNVHVGANAVQNVTVSNVAANDGFSENLNVALGALTGDAFVTSGSSGVSGLAAGSSTVPISLGIDTSTAGAKSGSLTLNYASDGAGTSGLAAIAAGSETITVNGTVYRLASANTLAPTIDFGNVLVGSVQAQALTIQNTAVNDGFSERLDARFLTGGTTGDATNNGGTISLLGAGVTDSASMAVGINTASIGAKSGQVVVAFDSNGLGTSDLGITALPNQTLSVLANITGTVGTLAQPSAIAPNPVDFGNVRIGSAPLTQTLSISNNAVIGEGLDASISTASAGFGASGAFLGLAPGATDGSTLQVQFTGTGTAGAQSGTATVALVSDGTFNGGVTTTLPSQTVNMSGNVYRLASPVLDTPVVNLAARRGDANPTTGVGVTNASPDVFTEGLKADISTAAAGFSASGAIANLAAGGSDAASLGVALDTSSAGAKSGTATVAFTSTGAGTTGAADVSVGSALVSLVGRVYETAVASVDTALVNFGIVHVGDVVASQAVAVSNIAPSAALNDTLKGSISTAAAGFNASGSFSGLTAGGSDTTTLLVDLDTSTAGFFSGSAGVAFASSNPDMADLDLGSQSVSLAAQVNNFADANLRKAGGMGILSAVGDVFTFDFGTLVQGSGVRSATLDVFNDVFGPSDLLDGQFSAVDTDDFNFLAGFFDLFVDLGAGQAQGGFGISFDPVTLGLVSDDVTLLSEGHNASGFRGALGPITLRFTANVIAAGGGTGTVPAPGTALLFASALLVLATMRRRARSLR